MTTAHDDAPTDAADIMSLRPRLDATQAQEPMRASGDSVTYRTGVGLIITSAVIDDAAVAAEALHWTTGARREATDPSQLDGADLGTYHRAAVCLGARVLQATGDQASAVALATTVTQLAGRAEEAGATLVDGALRASTQVIEAAAKATKEATEATAQIIDGARERFQHDVSAGVEEAMQTVQRDLDRLLGADDSAAVAAIKGVIGRAMTEAQVAWHRSLTMTLTEVSQTLDVSNPASPLGTLERRMLDQQQRQHTELTTRLDRVQELIGSTTAAATTAAAVASERATSPAKGRPYQETVGETLEEIAAGMGASYVDTADRIGAIKACKKGDGVIEASAGEDSTSAPTVVVELTTQGHPRNWSTYFDAAEQNRGAQASLGIVPSAQLVPGGAMLAIISPSRMVIAFNPAVDNAALLRATIQLLVVEAQRRLSQHRGGDLGLADTRLDEARHRLLEMQEIIKSAVSVRNGASKIVAGLEGLHSSLTLAIDQARTAINAAPASGSTAA